MSAAFITGLGFGALVAAQIGPISLLLIRSVVRGGRVTVGIAIGAGAAVVDTGYAALGIAGAGPVLVHSGFRPILGILGAAVIAVLGFRTLWSAFRVRTGGEMEAEVRSPRRAFLTSLAATASNPTTIGSWAAIFAAASAAGVARTAVRRPRCWPASGSARWRGSSASRAASRWPGITSATGSCGSPMWSRARAWSGSPGILAYQSATE